MSDDPLFDAIDQLPAEGRHRPRNISFVVDRQGAQRGQRTNEVPP